MTQLCSDDHIQRITQTLESDPEAGLAALASALEAHPEDARLHFLQGSTLLGLQRYVSGHDALSKAVELAPDFAIARFQLGLFQLTSGEVDRALETLGPIDRLPKTHYLRSLVSGLRCLVRDEFDDAIGHLRVGIEQNTENPPLNRDMEMLISTISQARSDDAGTAGDGDDPADEGELSEAALLLSRNRFKPDRH